MNHEDWWRVLGSQLGQMNPDTLDGHFTVSDPIEWRQGDHVVPANIGAPNSGLDRLALYPSAGAHNPRGAVGGFPGPPRRERGHVAAVSFRCVSQADLDRALSSRMNSG